jgi:DNA replication and repair protein RecF
MITHIRLQHFRSYIDTSFELAQGVNIIAGPNASGKTNLLEAVLVAARGSSYKARDAELMRFNESWARIDAKTPSHKRVVKLQGDMAVSKSFEIDGQALTRLHQTKTLPVVLFEPNHLLLLSGSPDMRRTFLDDLIEQTEPRFGAMRRNYRRVLAQRNALLKKNPPNLAEQLFVWNLRLSELGGQIARERIRLIRMFNERIAELYSGLAQRGNTVELQYVSRFAPEHYESALLRKLEASTELDVLRGFTAYGPHRDDLTALIDGRPVQETASRGETRTLVLALKILELQLLEKFRGVPPMLLLDDVFSELDSERRRALTNHINDHQVLITTTDADVVTTHLSAQATIISLTHP